MSARIHKSDSDQPRRHTQRSVPVRRRIEVDSTRRSSRTRGATRAVRSLGMTETLVYLAAALAVLSLIAVPLHTYMQQSSEIRELETSIAAKQEEKKNLEKELARNTSEAYQDEQIRRRLGAVAEGESAFRIIDPAMSNLNPVTSKGEQQETTTDQPWYSTVWRSVMDPRAAGVSVHDPTAEPQPEDHAGQDTTQDNELVAPRGGQGEKPEGQQPGG